MKALDQIRMHARAYAAEVRKGIADWKHMLFHAAGVNRALAQM